MSEQIDPFEFAKQKQFGRSAVVEDALTRFREEDIKKMPERVFNGVFMPLFANEKLLYNQSLEHWVNFAGNPYMPVDVVDANNNVLFRVPALLNRDMINPISGKNNSTTIGHLITTYQQYSMQSPQGGAHFLRNELQKRSMIMKTHGDFIKELEIWNMIFTRYGRKPILELTAEQKKFLNKESGDQAEVPDFVLEMD